MTLKEPKSRLTLNPLLKNLLDEAQIKFVAVGHLKKYFQPLM